MQSCGIIQASGLKIWIFVRGKIQLPLGAIPIMDPHYNYYRLDFLASDEPWFDNFLFDGFGHHRVGPAAEFAHI